MNQFALMLPARNPVSSRLALRAATAAAILGLAGDLLFNRAGIGVNLAVWGGLALAAVWLVASSSGIGLRRRTAFLLAASAIPAAAVAWRSSEWLHAGFLGFATTLVGLAVGLPPATGLRRMGFAAFVFALCTGSLAVLVGWLRFLPAGTADSRALRWLEANGRWVGRGLALSLVLALTFGGLFVAADAVIEHYVTAVASIDGLTLARHFGWFVACSWLGLGLLWSALALEAPPAPPFDLHERHRLSRGEVGLPLGAMALVFGLFVLVQVRFFFGGHSLVERTAGLTYSSYARRGFFELVVAVALVLPVILAFDWARHKDFRTAGVFRLLSGLLLMLLAVVVLSAVQKLRIYAETFGLTELRFYALAFLALTVIELGACAATVLRLRPQLFISASLVLIALWLGSLSILNPDAAIARVNIERASEGKRFDPHYLAKLGADAVPTIVRDFDSIRGSARCPVASQLLAWLDQPEDWRSWTWSRQRARDSVRLHRDLLEGACRA